MAGCERVEVSGSDGGPKTARWDLNVATLVNNFSLYSLSKVILKIGAMKGKDLPTGNVALHKSIDWRAVTLTEAMLPCYNGSSYTTMLFCVS